MPTTKEAASALAEWDLADRLEELRGKHHLKSKALSAYQDNYNDEIRQNEKIIAKLRHDNWNKRVLLAQQENGFEQVIKTAFKDNQHGRLCLQRCTARSAIEEMDQKVCEAAKELNEIRYEQEKKEKKLAELAEELERMKHLQNNCHKKRHLKTHGSLENALDKAAIKHQTTLIVYNRYLEIKHHLSQESLMMPAKLDAMEEALIEQRKELEQLQELAKSAQTCRDNTRRELSRVEQMAYESRKAREVQLAATKKEVEKRKADAEKVEKKYGRATLYTDVQDVKQFQQQQDNQKLQNIILSYEEAFSIIQDSTSVTNIQEVVERYKMQQERRQQLKNQLRDLQTQSDKLKGERDKLTETFKKMKYSGEQTLSKGQQLLEEEQTKLDQMNIQKADLLEQVDKNGRVLTSMKQGVAALLKLFDPIKLKPPENNYRIGGVLEQMELCLKKTILLSNQMSPTQELGVISSLPQEEFAEFIKNRLSASNFRIKLVESESTTSGFSKFDYEGQESGEQAPTRSDIKGSGQKLMDTKTGSTKKRRKEKKK